MMKTRIFTAILLCFTLLFSMTAMVACGGDGQSEETRDPNKPAATLDSIYAAVSAVVPDADKLTDAQATHLSGFFNGAVPEDFASYKIVMQTMSTSIDQIGIFEAKSADARTRCGFQYSTEIPLERINNTIERKPSFQGTSAFEVLR